MGQVEQSERFGAAPDQATAARRYVVAVLHEWGLTSDEVVLAVSELASNAIRHAHSPFRVALRQENAPRRERRVVLEVEDDDAKPPVVTLVSPTAIGGRGLMMIDRLATRWGSRPTPGGKVVWAQFDCPTAEL